MTKRADKKTDLCHISVTRKNLQQSFGYNIRYSTEKHLFHSLCYPSVRKEIRIFVLIIKE